MAVSRTPSSTSALEAFNSGAVRSLHRLASGDLQGAVRDIRRAPRPEITSALLAYLKRIAAPTESIKNAERLAHPRSGAVVAGQQAGWLTGPALTVTKAVNAITLAGELDRKDQPVIPVFWVASQDHDTLEVSSTRLMDFDERLIELRISLPKGVPVGRIRLEDTWKAEAKASIAGQNVPNPWKALVEQELNHAFEGQNLGEAFARLMSTLLGHHGLVVLDPLAPEFSFLFREVLEREIDDPLLGPMHIENAARALEAQGVSATLRRPAQATNLFLEDETGQRRLLRFDGQRFTTEARSYSRDEIKRTLASEPSRISPAAGLRPVVQDSVLPTIAAILGPSELAYQLQLLGVYEFHGIPQPLLWPRMQVTWIEAPTRRALKRFDLSVYGFMRNPDESIERALLKRTRAATLFEMGLEHFDETFAALLTQVLEIEPTLEGSVERARKRVLHHVSQLQHKLGHALVRTNSDDARAATRLKHHLLPAGIPQERSLSFLTYRLKYGPSTLELLLALPSQGTHLLEP